MRPQQTNQPSGRPPGANRRIQLWYGVLLVILGIFAAKLFYLQIIKHDHYQKAALADQLKEYKVAPARGIIEAHDGDGAVPIVLNEKLYTLYADPLFVKDVSNNALKLSAITKGNANDYAQLMKTAHSRYAVLAKRLSLAQKNQIEALRLRGVGLQTQNYRTYPQGTLAAQLLGFVNNDGIGTYGVEQALNKELSGKEGLLKAITDAAGVPLVASKENIQINPVDGDKVVLSIDAAMQKQLENILKAGLEKDRSKSGSALIIDPYSGAVKAMANLPSYDPAQYFKQADASVFNNSAVSEPLEVGSIMKTLTASAAIDLGVINQDTSYYDPGVWHLDDHSVTNVEEDGGAGTRNIGQILNLSINTGATWMLMQMGGQTGVVNKKARDRWHDYMVNHFGFGKPTGIEQGYEAGGYVPNPDKGDALQLTYANTAFGQAMTATPLQMGAALASVINGGTYYQPRLVDQIIPLNGKTITKKPVIVRNGVVSAKTSEAIRSLLEYVIRGHVDEGFSYLRFPDGYSVGGKTGTAQIANPSGGYYADKFNGTYTGYVGGDRPQYVIVIKVNDPDVGGYAGAQAAQPIFASLAHMLINDFNITPKNGS